MESFVGKSLKNTDGEEYIVLSEFNIKDINCVYAMKVEQDDKEGDKRFYQLTSDEIPTLVNIKSNKLIKSLNEALTDQIKNNEKPRKIKEDESIQEYLSYLDEFYRSRLTSVI